jgi:hypothetical protein
VIGAGWVSLALVLQASAPAAAPDSGIVAWVRGVDPGPGVEQELERWRSPRGDGLSTSYRGELARLVRTEVGDAADRAVAAFREGTCVPGTQVTFGPGALGPPGHATLPASTPAGSAPSRDEARFQEGLVRVEATACFPAAVPDPEAALVLYTSPEVRMEGEPRIRAIHQEEGDTCVETRGVTGLLAPTLTCHRIHRFTGEGIAAEHSQLVANPGDGRRSGFQAIYLKESVKTFVALPGGGLALHYVNVTRSGDLGRIERWVGSGAIRDGEKRKVEVLGRYLEAGRKGE